MRLSKRNLCLWVIGAGLVLLVAATALGGVWTDGRVSIASSGTRGNAWSWLDGPHASSADGRFMAFVSEFDNRPFNILSQPEFGDVFQAERPARASPVQIAVFRPSSGKWLLREDDASASILSFGSPVDQPAPADYLGTGFAQAALFHPSTGAWLIRDDAGAVRPAISFGQPGDLPVPADYLGRRRAQVAVFRPRTAQWLIRNEAGNVVGPITFGKLGDRPVPADYLGLGRAQIAVVGTENRWPGLGSSVLHWFIRTDAGATVGPIAFGEPGDLLVPADYLGLVRSQIAVFRPTTAEWLIRGDNGAATRIAFGAAGDVPVPGDYVGSGLAQIAVYRPASGEWFLRLADGSTTRLSWGGPGDRPLAAALASRFGMP